MKRAKRETQKVKRNWKTTEIKCFRCGYLIKAFRKDTRFCSDLCRVHERESRLENGYVEPLFEGAEDEMKKFFGWGHAIYLMQNPLLKDYLQISTFINSADRKTSWKQNFTGFIVYHFPTSKSNPFQIYYTTEKLRYWMDYSKKESGKMNKKKEEKENKEKPVKVFSTRRFYNKVLSKSLFKFMLK